jgi:uncharacterized protein YcbX
LFREEAAMDPTIRIAAIYRYPVKGLSPQALDRAELTPGDTLPGDRRFAIENGPSGFDPAAPRWMPKARFLTLMRTARLAALDTAFDEATGTLTIRQNGCALAQGDLRTVEGRAAIEAFLGDAFAVELRGPPKIVQAEGHSFSDVAGRVVSILNPATVAAVEDAVGAPVDPLRFRANLHVSGWPAWHELDLVGRTVAVGTARLAIVERIGRCAATEVEPGTGLRDLPIPRSLEACFGHADCGVYAEVVAGGTVAVGDAVVTADG